MNQCYKLDVIVIDGQMELDFVLDVDLYYQFIIWSGVWILYVWFFDVEGGKYLIFDIIGGGSFILFMGLGGEVWVEVVVKVSVVFGIMLKVYVIGLC